jgi:hypothetical protein
MTDQQHLERSCRRLLAWYPRAFWRESGPEILAVLLACAPDGQRRPGLAQAADLIRSGVWMRLRPSAPRSARTVRAAVRLMCAGAAVSTVNLIILLAFIVDIKLCHAVLGLRLIAAQVSQVNTPGLGPVVPVLTGLVVPVLTGLAGAAAVCLLWLPASSAFFRSQGYMQARHKAQRAELARIRSSRARRPGQV